MRILRPGASVGLLLAAGGAGAHALASPEAGRVPWTFDAWIVLPLALSLGLYGAGLAALWRRAGEGRGIKRTHAAAFVAGWVALAAALMSPLNALGSLLFSAHMVQHELLMVVAAPLLVIGRPLAVWTWGLPPAWRRDVTYGMRSPAVLALWGVLTYAPTAWALHGIVLWAWHIPAFFEAALANEALHTLQHISFFLTALLFWWAPLGSRSRTGHGASMLYLFTTMVHTGALGALLTLSPTIWFASYGNTAAQLGIDPLEDQQLGGLVMWVPAGLAYLFAGIAAAAAALQLDTHTR
jgi:putative membrane protein